MSFEKLISSAFGAKEWLITDGRGGYALGTCDTHARRRYHSYLTIAALPPIRRISVVGFTNEYLVINNVEYNLFDGGDDSIEFNYTFNESAQTIEWSHSLIVDNKFIEIKKSLSLLPESGTNLHYSINTPLPPRSKLVVRPVLYQRCHHRTVGLDAFPHLVEIPELQQKNSWCMKTSLLNFQNLMFKFSESLAVECRPLAQTFIVEYEIEAQRGFEKQETINTCFDFDIAIPAKNTFAMDFCLYPQMAIASTPTISPQAKEINKVAMPKDGDEKLWNFTKALAQYADNFLVQGDKHKAIIAGYPWFGLWARDAFISLPGICLVRNKLSEARSILDFYANNIEKGLVPNRFYMSPDRNSFARDYASADATMWFLYTTAKYAEIAHSSAFIREYLEHIEQIVDWHIKGTSYNIHVDTDGLIYAGCHGVPLTWMHAHIGDRCFTPRAGKPIEINALWISGLTKWAQLAKNSNKSLSQKLDKLAQKANTSFAKYWNSELGWFADVIDAPCQCGYCPDYSLRPNQIIALALPHISISAEQRERALRAIKYNLLVDAGLRGLSQRDSRYISSYIGSPEQRDMAYHNGPAWPWLLGFYISAQKLAFGAESMGHIAEVLRNIQALWGRDCIGHLAEIYDGDYPFAARGCPAQAASLAEILRALVNDYFNLSTV